MILLGRRWRLLPLLAVVFGSLLLAAPALSTHTLVREWGGLGPSGGRFEDPSGIDVGPTGDVFVLDNQTSRVQVFEPDGDFIRQWGRRGFDDDGKLDYPEALAVDDAGNVFVADTGSSRIQVFDSAGNFLRKWSGSSAGGGLLWGPEDIAVDDSGNVFVSDSATPTGSRSSPLPGQLPPRKWGTDGTADGQFKRPTGIDVDAAGNVFVLDWFSARIQVFDSQGELPSQVGQPWHGRWPVLPPRGTRRRRLRQRLRRRHRQRSRPGFRAGWRLHPRVGRHRLGRGQFRRPKAIAVDASGNVLVADSDNFRVQAFDTAGNFVRMWGGMPARATGSSAPRMALRSTAPGTSS